MSSLDYLNKGVKQMENSNNSKFEGISIKIPKAKFMKSDKSMAYKHGDAPKRFLNPLRDWIQSDRVRNKRKNEVNVVYHQVKNNRNVASSYHVWRKPLDFNKFWV